MKKLLLPFLLLAILSCSGSDEEASTGDKPCGYHAGGAQLYLGPQGGCYYINSNNNKTYVDRADCKC